MNLKLIMQAELSVIIVNYNSHRDIENCVNSIIANTLGIDFEIIIVDNNSPDRTIDKYANMFDKTKIYFLDSNLGFGHGCNYGVSKSSGKYVVFVNPDTIFSGNTLKDMRDFLNINTNAAACSPLLLNKIGSTGYVFNYFPDLIWEVYDFLASGYNFRLNKLNRLLKEHSDSGKALKVDWLTAACLMIRKDVFDKAGGFCSDYFLYYEDVDLQLRITNNGGEIYCLPYLKVIHIANTSTKPDGNDSVYYFNMYKSKFIYYKRNGGFLKSSFVKYLHLLGFFLRIVALNFRTRYSQNRKSKKSQYNKLINYYLKGIG